MKLLINRPKKFKEESLRGYMIRLSEMNHNPDVTFKLYKLTDLYKFNKPKNLMILDDDTDLSKLANLLKEDIKTLELLTFQPYFSYEEQNMKMEQVRYQFDHFGTSMYRSQICTQCLKESEYMRKIWDMTIVSNCHIHHCKLYDQCPSCTKIISPYRKRITFCDCGFDLRKLQIIFAEDVSVSRLFHEKLFFTRSINSNNFLFEERISFQACTWIFIYFTGLISGTVLKKKRMKYSKLIMNSDVSQLSQAVFMLFEDWPHNFYCFLDVLRIFKKGNNRFGRFQSILFGKFDSTDYKMLIQAYIQYIAQYWEGGYSNKNILTSSNIKLLNILQVSEETLKETLTLTAPTKRAANRKRISQKNNKEDYEQDDLMSIQNVGKMFGVYFGQIDAFRKSDLIKAIRGPGIDGYAHWLFSRQSVHRLKDRLDSKLNVAQKPNEFLITTNNAKKLYTTWGHTLCDLVEDILNGNIKPYSNLPNTTLKDFRFSKEELMKTLKRDNYSVDDLSKEMNVSKKFIASWINKGYLKSYWLNDAILLVQKEEFFKFQKNYIPGAHALKKQTKVKSVESFISLFKETRNSTYIGT